MKLLRLTQGSPEWVAVRARYAHCASEAPAMMGDSKRLMRSDLVRMKATGDEKEFSQWVRDNLLANGHEVEATARPLVESEIGEELYPVTATDDAGDYLASFDGLTMDAETSWEHKLWNEELAAAVRAESTTLPGGLHWQLEHQLLVGAPTLKRIRFTVSDGTAEKKVEMVYEPVPGRAAQLKAGWKQFDEDVASYVHVEVIPRAVAEPVMGLPAVSVQVKGDIAIISNLDLFGERLKAFIDALNKEPETDQDFANADQAVKVLKEAEERLESAESAALAQTASVDELRRTVAMYRDLARTTRLSVGKLVEARKAAIREEIRQAGIKALAEHVGKINTRLGRAFMQLPDPHIFAEAMKGKKTVASLRDAVATALSKAKIECNDQADHIDANLKAIAEHGKGFETLFADVESLVRYDPDHLLLTVKTRIDQHKAADDKRIADAAAMLVAEQAEQERVVTSTQAVVPAPAARAVAGGSRFVATPQVMPKRPPDEAIVAAVADHFDVSDSQALAWLREMDFTSIAA